MNSEGLDKITQDLILESYSLSLSLVLLTKQLIIQKLFLISCLVRKIKYPIQDNLSHVFISIS